MRARKNYVESHYVAAFLQGLPALVVAAAAAASGPARAQAPQEIWLRAAPGVDRFIGVSSLREGRSAGQVLFTSRERTSQVDYVSHAVVNCDQRTRRDHIPGNTPEHFFDFGRLSAPVVQESEFACRWLRGEAEAFRAVATAKERLRPVSGPAAPAATPQAPSHAAASAPSATPREAPAREATKPSTGRTSAGSGFLVAQRVAVTNHHVVEGCDEVRVRLADEERSARVAASHEATDLALLQLSAPLGQSLPVRPRVELGEEVMVAGFPLSSLLSQNLVVTKGEVNSLSGLRNDPTHFQLSAGIHSGNSGGPVLDRAGAVVGVVVSKINALKFGSVTGDLPQNINFAIKPEVLRLFLDANRVSYSPPSAATRLDGPELAKRATRATLRVLCTQ